MTSNAYAALTRTVDEKRAWEIVRSRRVKKGRDGSVLRRMSPLVMSSGHSDLRIAATQPHFADHKSLL